MALIAISSISNKLLIPNSGADVEFDGFLSVSPLHNNTVSRRPLEDGFDEVEAIHVNSIVLAVEIIITDTPQSVLDRRNITNAPNIFGTQFIKNHTQRQLDSLEFIANNAQPVFMKTKYRTYENYLIQDFGYSETDEQGLRIAFTLIEIRTNSSDEVTDKIDDSIGLWS